jgi:hypothetical protein
VTSASIAAFSPTLSGVLRKRRFADLVNRQLDLFEEDERELLAEAAEADARWTHASAEESEELYGDYQLVVDAIAERLLDVRETYAASLDETAADQYRTTFDAAARKRFRRFASLLDGE